MAKTGLRYIAAAGIESEAYGALPTYGTGFVIGKLITANVSVETGEASLHANNMIVENDKAFTGGTISINTDDFGDDDTTGNDVITKLMPVTKDTVGGVEILTYHGSMSSPYVGVGYVKTKILRTVKYFTAKIVYKVQFGVPSDETSTKAGATEWQTPTIEGTIMVIDGYENDVYMDEATFATEAEAVAFVNTILNVGAAVVKTTLKATITSTELLTANTYTAATWADVAIALLNANTVDDNLYATQATVNAANAALDAAVAALVEV